MSQASDSSLVPRHSSLGVYLAERGLIESSERLTAIRRIGLGQSNLTFALEIDGGSEMVLRRPPPGPLPPRAHDVLRECRVMASLYPTPVPVPRVLLHCDDPAVIALPFYIT